MSRLDPDEQLKLDEQGSITLNCILRSPQTIIEMPTKNYVDSLQEISRSRRDLSSVFSDQDNKFDKIILTILDSVTVNRNPFSDNEPSTKKHIDDELDKNTTPRFSTTLQNYLKVSVGNDVYNLTNFDEIQITDTTKNENPNTSGYLLQNWVNDKNNSGKISVFSI